MGENSIRAFSRCRIWFLPVACCFKTTCTFDQYVNTRDLLHMELVFRMFGLAWVLPMRAVYLLSGRRNWFGKQFSAIWNFEPLCLMWLLWKEHNYHTFEDTVTSKNQLEVLVIRTLFDWYCTCGLTGSTTLLNFRESRSFCTIFLQLF